MKKMTKKISVILLTALMLFSSAIPSFAALVNPPTVQPMWNNIASIDLNICFDGAESEVSGYITRKAGVSKIDGLINLYEQIDGYWEYVGDWFDSGSDISLNVTGTFSAVSGRTYRAIFTVIAYRNGVAERETVEFIKTCP